MIKARGLGKMRLKMFAAGLVAVLGFSTSSRATTIQFSPDGQGAADAIGVGSISLAPGNALSIGSVPLGNVVPNVTILPLLYQAVINGFADDNGDPVAAPNGLNSTYQLTVVLRFNEVLTSFGGIPGAQTFALAANQTGSFVEFYYDSAARSANFKANALTGTGYNDGQLIASGTPSASLLNVSSFSFPANPNGTPQSGNLDQFGTNNYPGISSLLGAGSALVGSFIQAQDPNFFVTPVQTLTINGDLKLPYTETNPAALFDASANTTGLGTPGPTAVQAGVGSVGTTNGTSGPNFIFQTTGTLSFNAVPEPGTVGLALFGIGGAVVGLARSRRRSSEQLAA